MPDRAIGAAGQQTRHPVRVRNQSPELTWRLSQPPVAPAAHLAAVSSQRDARARTAHDAQIAETPTAILAIAAAIWNRGMIQKKAVSGARVEPPPKPKLICETIIAIQLTSAASHQHRADDKRRASGISRRGRHPAQHRHQHHRKEHAQQRGHGGNRKQQCVGSLQVRPIAKSLREDLEQTKRAHGVRAALMMRRDEEQRRTHRRHQE